MQVRKKRIRRKMIGSDNFMRIFRIMRGLSACD